MIGQYLSNNNENATVPILPKILHLNRAKNSRNNLATRMVSVHRKSETKTQTIGF
jgi:hypothetical protein